MAVITEYLRKLKFDPKLNNSFIGKYLHNIRLVILVIILVIILGIVSFLSIPRVLNPKINIAIVTISTVLPGAGPSDVETLITEPVEQAVNGVANIDTMTSISQDSVSIVTLQFNSGVDPEKAESNVQTAVQSVNNLPKDATTPHVQKVDFENQPIWTFSVIAKDPISLVNFSRALREKLKDVTTIDRVETSGLENREISVVIKPEAISTYGINPLQLSQAVSTAIKSQPGGNINTTTSAFSLTIDPVITTVEDLRNLRISLPNNTSVILSDVANIAINQKPETTDSFVATKNIKATPTVNFSVFKKAAANITTADADAQKAATDFAKKFTGITISTTLDSGERVTRQFNELVRDLLITFALVFLVILIFLGTRQAIIAAAAIPTTFLITFIVMHATNIDLSFISFFSLLLALGLLVDDTIVVISALSSYYKTNKFSPMEAGLLVWRDFKTAILTTTLTTVWAFVPLLLSTGIIGEFIKPIPIVVSSALLSSFGVAVFITLPLVIIVLKPKIPRRVTILTRLLLFLALIIFFFVVAPKNMFFLPALILFGAIVFIYQQVKSSLFDAFKNKIQKKTTTITKRFDLPKYFDKGLISFDRISLKYKSILNKILSSKTNRRKALIMVIVFSVFSYLLLPLGLVRNEFFPGSSQEFLQVTLEMPAGTNSLETKKQALQILNDLRSYPDVQVVTLDVGQGAQTGFGPVSGGSNIATIMLVLPTLDKQKVSSIDIATQIRNKYANFQLGKFSVIEESGGPPAGADLQIKLFGEELPVLDQYANKIENYLKKQQGITNVDKSIKSGTSKITFVPDFQKMIDANVTQDQLGLWLRTYASGFTLSSDTKIEEGNTSDQDIVFRTDSNSQTVDGLGSLLIPTQNGSIPLTSLGTISIKPNPTLITRENSKRTISVTAGVLKGYSVSQKNSELEKFADTLNLPEGYSWKTGGVNEQNQQSVNSIFQAMILSFLLIIVTMVLQFISFRKAFIVMLVIPLSISGVFIVFAITHTPLSFPALIGVLALFGIVVKNAILIVDKINQNLKAGIKFKEAIIEASESRLEPIALTSFTAIVGLIPITLSNPLWQGLGGAIIAGLMFSGSIMLFFIPVVYYYIFVGSEGKSINK